MDIVNVVVTFLVAAAGTGYWVVFRLRQLYAVIPRLFVKSSVSTSGIVAELTVINRGRRTEEGVRVELNPNLQVEILAASASALTLENGILGIDRIPPRGEVSVVLLVEDSQFRKEDISAVSSKEAKGKVYEKMEEVPPNFGTTLNVVTVFLVVAAVIWGFLGQGFFSESGVGGGGSYERIINKTGDDIRELGWFDLDKYIDSSLVKVYGTSNFPISEKKHHFEDGLLHVQFDVHNLTGRYMSATVELSLVDEIGKPLLEREFGRRDTTGDIPVGGVASMEVAIAIPTNYLERWVVAEFTLMTGDEFIYDIKKKVSLEL